MNPDDAKIKELENALEYIWEIADKVDSDATPKKMRDLLRRIKSNAFGALEWQ